MNFMVEFLPTDGVVLFNSIKVAKLYTFGGSTESLTIACQFFVMLFFGIFIYREGKKIYKAKTKYFNGFWNICEFTIIVLVFAVLGVFFSRMMLVNRAIKNIQDNPGQFVSFNKVTQWDTMFTALTSILVFISCIKAIKLLQYNKTIALLAATLQGSARPLSAFFICFMIFFMAYTTSAYIIFVPYLADYKSFITACESVLTLLLGSFSYNEIKEAQPVLAPIWFLTIMLFGVMYIMNVFMTIVMDTYSSVKDDLDRKAQEFEVVEFMTRKFKFLIGKGDGGKKELMDKIAKEEAANEEKKKLKEAKYEAKKNKPDKKQYMELSNKMDDEIEQKFAQLDDSLNGIWQSNVSEEIIANAVGKQHYDNYGFDYEADEQTMQKDLQDELGKWE
jgi:polycystin 1L2